MSVALFQGREQAGRALAVELERFRGPDTVVVGLSRGGVQVAYEVASALDAPLDVCVTIKITLPTQPDAAVGAVSERGVSFVRNDVATAYGLSDDEVRRIVRQKRAEVAQLARLLRRGGPPANLRGKTVLLVDDGVASGNTARAALRCLRQRRAARLVLAVPVGPAAELQELAFFADEVVCPHPDANFVAIALGYEDFQLVTATQAQALLQGASSPAKSQEPGPATG